MFQHGSERKQLSLWHEPALLGMTRRGEACMAPALVFVERCGTEAVTIRVHASERADVVGFLRWFGGPRQQPSQSNLHR